ncbi:MAG: hypothetical protein EOP49_14950 [Sphingobacteriales bacterium]|nr:MAG: hypothetical protein EOP49_14950 [Sphingobacteriales bacterium]
MPKLIVAIFISLLCLGATAQAQATKEDDYDRGYRYLYDKVLDSAYFLLDNYISTGKDSLKKGKAYLYIGEILWNTGDLYGAEEYLAGSLRFLNDVDSAHREHLSYTYSILGNISIDLQQYTEAIDHYNNGLQYAYPDFVPELMNGKATTLQKMKRYADALAVYDSLRKLPFSSYSLLARIVDNTAYTKWLASPGYNALPDFHWAKQLRKDSGHQWGLNASYAHLAEFHTARHPDSALYYSQKMLATAQALGSTEDVLQALDKLVRLSPDAGRKNAFYDQYKFLRDSMQRSKDTTRSRFAMIRYEVQKSKADNLELQQENRQQRLWMWGLTGAAILGIAGIRNRHNKRRKKIKQEADNSIRHERLKTSQKVHDVVANGLYNIMNELEHSPAINREPMLNKIEDLYEKSRNISYEEPLPPQAAGFPAKVHALLSSFSNEHTRVIIVGNQPAFWNQTSPLQQQQLQLVLNELMVNMKKHSSASNVSVIFKQEHRNGFVLYKDDGQGLPANHVAGNGLQNTVNRINGIDGAITFGKTPKGGLAVDISFPLHTANT